MVFGGMQRVSLLDYPGLVSCTVFTVGCNFRCPFCHNAALALGKAQEAMPEEDVLAYLKKRAGVLDGLTVSGGEPLLWPRLADFLEKAKTLGYRVKLDTNGSRPEALRALVDRGLIDRVAMDIKNSPEDYEKTAGIPGLSLSAVDESRRFLLSGGVDYEFRTTVVRGLHTKQSLSGAARWIAGAKAYYLQGFSDSGALLAPQGLGPYTPEEMADFLEIVKQYVPNAALRGV